MSATRGLVAPAALGPIDSERPLASLIRLLAHDRRRIVVALALFVVKDSPLWLLPVFTSEIVDVVATRGVLEDLVMPACFAGLLLAVNVPANLQFLRLYNGASRGLGARLRSALAEHLQSLSIGFHTRSSSAVIQSKVVHDVENIELVLQQAGPGALSAVLVICGAVTMTAIRAPEFLAVYIVTVPIAAALTLLTRRRVARRNEDLRKQIERLSSLVGEMASLVPVTRAHGLEATAIRRVADSTEDVRRAGLRLDTLNGFFGAASWAVFQVLGFACLVIAALVSIEDWLPVTAGQVVLLANYFGLLTGAITQLITLLPIVTRGNESFRSIAEVLEEPDIEANEGRRPVDDVVGGLLLQHVSFTHEGAAQPALDDIDLEIHRGETVAFVGRSGSGKSTLLNLVLGFIRPADGRILLDGRDMQALDLRSVRRFVSVVPQEPVLFEGTIRENVTYGLSGITDDQIRDAMVRAHAADITDALPDGLETMVGERGARLSGGQRQRLAIARALVREPRILLLDEATSALDSESEEHVRAGLSNLMQDRTTLVVAHRLSTVRCADRIVVLEAGRIVESGSHDSLVSAGGLYSRLHLLQTM